MIALEQMFRNPTTGMVKPHTEAQAANARSLLASVNDLRAEWVLAAGKDAPIDPDTGTEISGTRNGTGGGGFREEGEGPSKYTAHKILWVQMPDGGWVVDKLGAKAAVDCFDPPAALTLDGWLDQFEDGKGGNSKLEEYELYREHPDDTPGWCHLTDRAPRSGDRTFKP